MCLPIYAEVRLDLELPLEKRLSAQTDSLMQKLLVCCGYKYISFDLLRIVHYQIWL